MNNKTPLINVNSFKFVAIIPSAGNSERYNGCANGSSSAAAAAAIKSIHQLSPKTTRSSFSSSSNKTSIFDLKQFSIVCNKPLIFHTVTAFLKLKWIDHIVVLTSAETLSRMEEILAPLTKQQQKRFDCIVGGSSRHRSIKEGLQFCVEKCLSPDFVIIHDGARPYVDDNVLHQLVTECYQHGVSGVYVPLTSTILLSKSDTMMLEKVLNRSHCVSSETPQAFRYNLILDAYKKCTDQDLDHNTECLDLVKKYCRFDAKLIRVDPTLYFKVTYRKDLYSADNILKEHRNILLHCDFSSQTHNVNYKFIKDLKDDLCSNFANVKFFNNSMEMKQTHHSTGTVHVLLHYCDQWNTLMQQSLASYENLVYIVINNDLENEELHDGAYYKLIKWSKNVKSKEIKNFYLIFTHTKNVDQESLRIRNTVVYLSKELPSELCGQSFFI